MKKEEDKYDFDSQDPIYVEEPGLAYQASDPEADDVRRGLKVLARSPYADLWIGAQNG